MGAFSRAEQQSLGRCFVEQLSVSMSNSVRKIIFSTTTRFAWRYRVVPARNQGKLQMLTKISILYALYNFNNKCIV